MKKIVTLGLVTLLFLFLAARGSKEENTEASPAGNSSALTNSNTNTPPVTATVPQDEEAEVKVLIYDTDGVRIYYLGYAVDSLYGPQVMLYIENDMNIEISVYAYDFSVNGIMFTVGSDTRVPPEGTAKDSIYIVDTNFETGDITNVYKMEFYFDVINAKEKYRNNSGKITIDIKDL